MFCNLSKNKGGKESIRVYGVPLRSNRVNFTFGRPEWQQKLATTHNHFYDLKDLKGNREILDKPYLKRDYSGFKLIHFPQKRPFLTSNARDFVPIQMKEEDKAKLSDERLHFLKSSRVKWENITLRINPCMAIYLKILKFEHQGLNLIKLILNMTLIICILYYKHQYGKIQKE